jgi:hypothetical protein
MVTDVETGMAPWREWASPLAAFLLEPESWVSREALLEGLQSRGEQPVWPALPDPQTMPVDVLRHAVGLLVPMRPLDLTALVRDWRSRLALLPRDDWLRLGLAVSALPYSGHIQRSMDGHFRRAVQQALDAEAVRALDGASDAVRSVVFALGAGAWRQPHIVACCGVRAVLDQVCVWPAAVRSRFRLRFTPQESHQPPSVTGLDAHGLEITCQAIFPDHPWLWR